MNIRTVQKYYAKQRRNRALIFSLVVHVVFVICIGIWLLKPIIEQEKDVLMVDFVPALHRVHLPKKIVRPVASSNNGARVPLESLAAKRLPGSMSSLPKIRTEPKLEAPPPSTTAELVSSPESTLAPTNVKAPTVQRGSGAIDENGVGQSSAKSGKGLGHRGTGSGGGGLGNLTQGSGAGEDAFSSAGFSDITGDYADEIGDELGSIIDEEGGIVRGHIRLIRLKHDMSDWWQDPTAISSLVKWLQEHVKTISADMKYEGGALMLTNKKIMAAPLIIMTGHDQAMSVSYRQLADRNAQTSGFSEVERAALRKYILDYNGMLFFDYCGDGGNEKSFARIVENELRIVFPEYPLTTLENMRHDIFQSYFKLKKTPVGGSAFWGTGYKGGNDKWRYMKGMAVPGRFGKERLGVIFCPLDYLCSMETAEIDSRAPLSARRSSDVYRFMTNMFVYQMRQRANNN